MQSGHSEVCETVAALFLLAVKKIYKKTSLVHIKYTARPFENSEKTQIKFWENDKCCGNTNH